jgi:putative Mn2+ efflux pump MntP
MAYDALVDHASPDEREALLKRHSKPLLVMGIVSGLAGALPGLAWLGGAVINIVLFPFVAALAIWMYVVIFIFTGLWFAFYCMQALADLRRSSSSSPLGGGDSPAGLPPL